MIPSLDARRPQIYHLKGTPAARIGTVQADNEQEAIKKAFEEFKIEPKMHNKLMACALSLVISPDFPYARKSA
jgi:hypothetical protein